MLSRRNVRIKVMQMLYAMSRDTGLSYQEILSRYRNRINQSFNLYLFTLLYIIRIAEYARQDKARRDAKLLPSEEDKQFQASLYENDLVRSLTESRQLNQLWEDQHFADKIDEDNVRIFYTEFAKSKEYKDFLREKEPTEEAHQEILLALCKFCVQNETFNELIEDHFPNWVDDKSLIVGALKKTIKSLPAGERFYEDYRPSTEATVEFGEELLRKVTQEEEELVNLIEPTLKNWDADRVAVIDMILLKMALCELMSFPTIPSKVTLNEFVEISKLYSTEKSKDFINGILDRLMKKLAKEGKIKKEGRGLQE